MLTYVKGIAIPEPYSLCCCGCKQKHDYNTRRVYAGSVYWFKHGKYPNLAQHVDAWWAVVTEDKVAQGVLL